MTITTTSSSFRASDRVEAATAGRMPNFLIIGGAKGGTTSLYHYLAQHPDVFMSPLKEAKFFAYEGQQVVFTGPRDREKNEGLITTLDRYQELFRGATTQKAIGEASPHYLFVPQACERIRHHLPHAKLFAVLRDPVERAYSSFLHLIRDGREPVREFGKALDQEERRLQEGYAPIWAYKAMGFYHAQLKRYFDAFDRRQIHVYLYEDLKADPIGLMRQMFRTLGVDDTFVPRMTARYNVSYIPRSRTLHKLLRLDSPARKAVMRLPAGWRAIDALNALNKIKPQCPPDIRRRLVALYRDDIMKLQDLLQRDLSAWLKV